MKRYRVEDFMHIRTEAVLDERNILGYLSSGYIFNAVEEVKGARYTILKSGQSSDDWLRDANGFYYWKGTTTLLDTASVPAPAPAREWWFDFMQIERLWAELGTKGEGVNVVIWDTGLDEKLFGKVASGGYDFLNDKEGYTDRGPEPHGTEVARIIAGNQGGIAPNCSLFIAKAYSTSTTSIRFSKFANSQIFKNADVINISYNFRKGTTWANLISELESSLKGAQTVCAAVGNFIDVEKEVETWPGAIEQVVCVGAVNSDGTLYSGSPSCKHITLCAPGSEFRSIRPNSPNIQGTSYACALVSGIATLLISYLKKRGLTVNHSDIKKVLSDSHKPDSPSGGRWGNGSLDIETFIQKIKKIWP